MYFNWKEYEGRGDYVGCDFSCGGINKKIFLKYCNALSKKYLSGMVIILVFIFIL